MATLLTNTGKSVVTNRLLGAGTEPKYLAWGVGAGTTAASDNILFTEDSSASYARVAGTSSRTTTAVNNDTYVVTGTITNNSGGTLTYTNAGTFDAISGGNIFVKGDFASITLNNGDQITFTVKVQFT